MARKPYPSDVSDEAWAFAAPYLTPMTEQAPQREHDLREVFNGLRWVVRTGSPWRYMPHDLPPWAAVYQQGHPQCLQCPKAEPIGPLARPRWYPSLFVRSVFIGGRLT